MATRKAGDTKDAKLEAVQIVYVALKDLVDDERHQVLSSVLALLKMSPVTGTSQDDIPGVSRTQSGSESTTAAKRRLSLVELVNDRNPKTNVERIALFAYYREHVEGIAQFERDDLRPYFVKARMAPPTNYDRDFVKAIKQGWIHEEGSDSYLTNRGVQAVESGFGSPAKSTGSTPKRAAKRKQGRESKGRKARGRRS
jgi:hypothetical protein